MKVLEIEKLTKRFGGLTAVDEFSFDVEDGEILGFIGPNGSGKTTVFNCIMSVYSPTSGNVYFRGDDITYDDTHDIVNGGLVRVSQESNPVAEMTVAANIKLFTLPNSIMAFRGGADDSRIHDLAARVGIEDSLDEHPDELPHADVRRLEIAKALATDPDMILLDEPFAGMNHEEISSLSDLLLELRDEGITMVVVDHNMKGLMNVVDRVTVINNGEKLADGTPEEIAENRDVQEAYLADTEAI